MVNKKEGKMAKSVLDWIAFVLVIIGAVNWGLVGLFQIDLVNSIFGSISWLATIVYVLVGLAGLYMIYYVAKK
jgi:uncharacterized membrane protein YuzA (DUF378 family)